MNQTSRLSRLTDRSNIPNNNNLYQPLRNALRKSSINVNSYLSPPKVNNLSQSRLSQNARSLSPLQAQLIKKNVLIPIDRQLIPTHNMQRIQGKRFYAVDVQQKIGDPISQQQFNRSNRNTVQQIVYEVRDDHTSNIYTYRAPTIQTIPSSPRISSKQVLTATFRPSVGVMPRPSVTTVMHNNKNIVPIIPLQSKIIKNPLSPRISVPPPSLSYIKPTDYSQPRHMPTHAQNILPNSSEMLAQSKSQTSLVGMKPYDFRQSQVTGTSSVMRLKKSESYKYNLFSMLDQGGNTGCQNGCCGSNQIIAPKMAKKSWK